MGHVLGTTFGVYIRHIISFSLVTLSVWLPMIVAFSVLMMIGTLTPLGAYSMQGVDAMTALKIYGATMASGAVITMILYPVGVSVIFNATFQYLTEGRAQIGASITRGLARAFWVILLGLLVLLVLFLIGMVMAMVLGAIIAAAGKIPAPGSSQQMLLGFGVLVPLLYPMIVWIVAVPACVVERLGPIRSLGRSRRLTKGHRWQILFILIIGLVVIGLLGFGTNVGLAYLLKSKPIAMALIGFGVQCILNAFLFVLPGVLYYDLRQVKENVEIEKLSSVFD